MVWRPKTSSYDYYFYRKIGETIAWATRDNVISNDPISPSDSIILFLMSEGDVKMTTTGKIVKEKTVDVSLPDGIAFIANPYPTKLALNSGNAKNVLAGNFSYSPSDMIMRYSNTKEGYDYYSYSKIDSTTIGWVKRGEKTLTTDSFEVGEGFLLYRMGNVNDPKATFASPL